jgi:carboxypeptidase family protein/Big-like domain-containing protein/all-beta uncharacterized protein
MNKSLRRILVPAAVASIAATVAACAKNNNSSNPPTTPSPTVTSVAVTGSAPLVGLSAQLTATASLSNGTTQNVTSQATWQSSNTTLATVNNAGVVTGVAPGEVDITATYQSVAGRSRLTIVNATYSLSGTVTDATSGGILPNINMQITSGPSTGLATKTDAAGAYTLTGVLAGAATVSASAVGYETQAKTATVVGNTTLDFVLVRVPACRYTLSVTSQNVPATGGNFSFTATSPDACSWTASTSTSWITLAATSGNSPGTIAFTAAANTTISQRVGTIHVAWNGGSADVTVTQAANACTFDLNPQGASFSAAGGTGSFTLTPSDVACAWTAASDSSWLSITAGQSGTGLGTVSYSVQPYSGSTATRVGTILITGTVSGIRGFPVQQQPPP